MKQTVNPKYHAKRIIHLGRRIKRNVNNKLSTGRNYIFSIDSPRSRNLSERLLSVEGWIIPKKSGNFRLQVRNNSATYPVKTGIKRLDVAKTHPNLPEEKTLHSGFKVEFEFEDGKISLEIDNGKGYKKLYGTYIQFSVEQLPSSIYNKDLSNNYPEHINLLENRQKFYFEEALRANYERHNSDTRLVAMYLPQFHPVKENNEAWGKGFTEWSNVTTGQSRFIGHQQPILPKDLGFYDLRLESNIKEQIDLAKKYGIYGFGFYYYWFSGRKLMEKPLISFLQHKDWDFNFAICWANENWTKRWDGRDSEVIIAQEYLDDDPLNFIKDVEHILLDKRYIREDGKPILMVYRASELKDPRKYSTVWREYFREHHKQELQLVSFLSFDDQDPREYGFDAALDFAPLSAFFKSHQFENNQFPFIDVKQKLLDINFGGVVADYRTIALNKKLDKVFDFPTYQSITPSWDNEARKKSKGFVYQNSSPDLYARWLGRLIEQETAKKEEPLLFINAWNEWAEGAMLEPSVHLGHAALNRTAEVLAKYSHNPKNVTNFPGYGLKKATSTKLAVVVHLYYTDLWPAINSRLECIKEDFDLFVTLNERDKDFKPKVKNNTTKTYVYVLPNRGRDVLPFLYIAARLSIAGYKYVLKLHSKKSKHRDDGSSWFTDVLECLLSSTSSVNETLVVLKNTETGIIGPQGHLVSLKRHMGSNKLILEHLIKCAYNETIARNVIQNSEQFPYFGGTMFWARLDMFSSILNLYLMPDDFQSEHGQIDGTTAHALERMFGVVCRLENRSLYEVNSKMIRRIEKKKFTRKYKFAP
jgi:lipopolysaccharide biosynthesis protein